MERLARHNAVFFDVAHILFTGKAIGTPIQDQEARGLANLALDSENSLCPFFEDYVKIQNFQQTAAQDLQKQQDTLIAPITQKLQNAIQAVGAEGGYTFIFDQAAGSILYTGTNAEDVSAKVKTKLGIK